MKLHKLTKLKYDEGGQVQPVGTFSPLAFGAYKPEFVSRLGGLEYFLQEAKDAENNKLKAFNEMKVAKSLETDSDKSRELHQSYENALDNAAKELNNPFSLARYSQRQAIDYVNNPLRRNIEESSKNLEESKKKLMATANADQRGTEGQTNIDLITQALRGGTTEKAESVYSGTAPVIAEHPAEALAKVVPALRHLDKKQWSSLSGQERTKLAGVGMTEKSWKESTDDTKLQALAKMALGENTNLIRSVEGNAFQDIYEANVNQVGDKEAKRLAYKGYKAKATGLLSDMQIEAVTMLKQENIGNDKNPFNYDPTRGVYKNEDTPLNVDIMKEPSLSETETGKALDLKSGLIKSLYKTTYSGNRSSSTMGYDPQGGVTITKKPIQEGDKKYYEDLAKQYGVSYKKEDLNTHESLEKLVDKIEAQASKFVGLRVQQPIEGNQAQILIDNILNKGEDNFKFQYQNNDGKLTTMSGRQLVNNNGEIAGTKLKSVKGDEIDADEENYAIYQSVLKDNLQISGITSTTDDSGQKVIAFSGKLGNKPIKIIGNPSMTNAYKTYININEGLANPTDISNPNIQVPASKIIKIAHNGQVVPVAIGEKEGQVLLNIVEEKNGKYFTSDVYNDVESSLYIAINEGSMNYKTSKYETSFFGNSVYQGSKAGTRGKGANIQEENTK